VSFECDSLSAEMERRSEILELSAEDGYKFLKFGELELARPGNAQRCLSAGEFGESITSQ
jgi:hypothetical protein